MNHFNKSCASDKTPQRRTENSFYAGFFVTIMSGVLLQSAVAQVSVLTYRYDDLQTGWNSSETVLTPAAVGNSGLALQQTVPLDEQVDAQPLLVPGVAVKGQGTHDVVYVATENDTVYAIDAESGSILLSQNLGTPMPNSALTGGPCGNNVMVWRVQTSPRTALVQDSMSPTLPSGQDRGFLTSVSSNGTTTRTAIIWAVARPSHHAAQNVTLVAYDGSDSTSLFSAVAGSWPSSSTNANIVPIVANGRVYVASYKQLAIFGLNGCSACSDRTVALNAPPAPTMPAAPPLAPGEHEVFGIVREIHGFMVAMETRGGEILSVDTRPAARAGGDIVVQPGEAVDLRGALGASGAFEAHVMARAKRLAGAVGTGPLKRQPGQMVADRFPTKNTVQAFRNGWL